jgi:two-component system CheB/CheR fusion protein
MNEELQSTNEELRTINDQLQQRTQELHENQSFLEGIVGGIGAAIIAVDRELRILVWEEKARELWGLSGDEVQGQSLLDLDIGLPVEALRPGLEACLRGDPKVPALDLDAVNRRGAKIRCSVVCTPLRRDHEITGVVVMMERIEGPDVGGPGARRAPGPRRAGSPRR